MVLSEHISSSGFKLVFVLFLFTVVLVWGLVLSGCLAGFVSLTWQPWQQPLFKLVLAATSRSWSFLS